MSTDQNIIDATVALNATAQAYHQHKSDWDALLQAALETVPETLRYYAIDQVNGSDTATGSQADPLKSFQEAFDRTPPGGILRVTLLSDYTFTTVEICDGITVDVNAPTRRKLSADWVLSPGQADRLAGIEPRRQGAFKFTGIDIELPANPSDPVDNANLSGIIAVTGTHAPPSITSQFVNVNITALGSEATLLGWPFAPVTVYFTGSTSFPANFEGRIVKGYGGASIDPQTVSRFVRTNLTWI